MLTPEITNSLNTSVLCWLASITKDGHPNVSPKEIFAPFGDNHLVIANIASPGSVRNIKANPQICVSFVDVFEQKGYKLIGTAEIIGKQHANFDDVHAPLYAIAGDAYPIASVIKMKIAKVEEINAPSFHLFPDMPDADRRASAMQNYGVKPI